MDKDKFDNAKKEIIAIIKEKKIKKNNESILKEIQKIVKEYYSDKDEQGLLQSKLKRYLKEYEYMTGGYFEKYKKYKTLYHQLKLFQGGNFEKNNDMYKSIINEFKQKVAHLNGQAFIIELSNLIDRHLQNYNMQDKKSLKDKLISELTKLRNKN